MKYSAAPSSLFIENRKRFTAKMKTNSIAVFHANDQMPKSGDGLHPFKQNADLFWLTGIDQEDTMLILYPDSPKPEYKEVLFLRKTNETIAVWEGHKYTIEEARTASGIKTIVWNEEFNT
ncbi:MAG TPA: X-Pro aminopeptidase, partial [Bacteroidetes bacterium]|nr:X-Pro aminopeptidase [Bacteroidota bacterium]